MPILAQLGHSEQWDAPLLSSSFHVCVGFPSAAAFASLYIATERVTSVDREI